MDELSQDQSLTQAQDWRGGNYDSYGSDTDEDQTQLPDVEQDISTLSISQVSSFLLKHEIPQQFCSKLEGMIGIL